VETKLRKIIKLRAKQAQTQKIHYSNIEKYYSNLTQPFYFNTFKKQI